MENNPQDVDQAKYIDSAMRAVREKKPLPEIDFTLHTMEDGSQVSTMERVCKGTWLPMASAPQCNSLARRDSIECELQLTPL
jgi:serine/threonine-protein phosphatase 2B catalytic subunit